MRSLTNPLALIVIIILVLAVACGGGEEVIPTPEPSAIQTKEGEVTMHIISPAFRNGEAIPRKYTCDGDDVSPQLEWGDVPPNVISFALIVDDPDAPVGTWVHWVLYNIPGETYSLAEAITNEAEPAAGGQHGINDWDRLGYGGPCPPGGTHRYYFKLYALDATLELPVGATKNRLLAAMEGHVLAQAEFMGKYSRE